MAEPTPIEEAIGSARSLVGLWRLDASPNVLVDALSDLAEKLTHVNLSEAQDTAASSGLDVEAVAAALDKAGGHVDTGTRYPFSPGDARRAALRDMARVVLSELPRPASPKEEAVARRAHADDWWTEGTMVNVGLPGDEGFVADAATPDDAERLVEAHNAALAQPTPVVETAESLNEWRRSGYAPEPSLRVALATALRTTEWWLHCHSQPRNEWTTGELADAIIAAEPRLSLSAQPQEKP